MEKLHGVKPGKKTVGNRRDLQYEQEEAVRRAESPANAVRIRCDFCDWHSALQPSGAVLIYFLLPVR